MKKSFVLVLVLVAATFSGCKVGKLNKALCRTWVHAVELDAKKVKTYKPASVKMSPVRGGRKRITFNKDKTTTMRVPGRGDKPQIRKGTWKWESPGKVIVVTPGFKGDGSQRLKILKLTDYELKVTRALLKL